MYAMRYMHTFEPLELQSMGEHAAESGQDAQKGSFGSSRQHGTGCKD